MNALELAALRQLALEHPALVLPHATPEVVRREFSGVGSFTTFRDDITSRNPAISHFSLAALITMPGIAHGMTAVVFCRPNEAPCLELVTYGGEPWAGEIDGFVLEPAS